MGKREVCWSDVAIETVGIGEAHAAEYAIRITCGSMPYAEWRKVVSVAGVLVAVMHDTSGIFVALPEEVIDAPD